MSLPKAKFETGSNHRITVGDCDGQIRIQAKTYDERKDAWIYFISGNGCCGKWSEWVNENFIVEHKV